MIRFTLFGIPITIEPWHWIFLLIIGSGIGNDLSGNTQLLTIAVFVIAATFSVLVHELGHALAIKSCGFPTGIVLTGLGGYAFFPANIATRRQHILITACGPIAQLLLALVSWLILQYVSLPTEMASVLVSFLFVVSFFWALLNLIPVIPLDGGVLLAHFLGQKRYKLSLKISIAAAIIGGFLVYYFFHSFIFPVILAFYASRNFRELNELH